MKQTLSDNFFNWFRSVKEWFQNIFERDDNFNDDNSFVCMGFYNYVLSQKQIWYDRFSVLPAASRYQALLVAGFIT